MSERLTTWLSLHFFALPLSGLAGIAKAGGRAKGWRALHWLPKLAWAGITSVAKIGQRRSAVEACGSAAIWSPNLFVAWLIETLEAGSTSPLAAAGLEHTHVV